MNVTMSPIELGRAPSTDEELMRFVRAMNLEVEQSRQIDDIWHLTINGHNVYLDKERRIGACDCLDSNSRRIVCKHIYRGILYIGGKLESVSAFKYASSLVRTVNNHGRQSTEQAENCAAWLEA